MSADLPQPASNFSPIEHVRKRPGMYFGDTRKESIHLLVWEVVKNAVNQVIKGHCDQIEVTLYDSSTIAISDNGEGIPVDAYQDSGKSILELIFTTAGGKHLDENMRFRATVFGVGLAAVNAVSDQLKVEVKRDGFLWQQTYAKGEATSKLVKVRPLEQNERTGTTITFQPDFTIFAQNDFDYELVKCRLNEWAYLVRPLTIQLDDKRSNTSNLSVRISYLGMADYVRHINRDYKTLHEPIVISEIVPAKRNFEPLEYDAKFEIAIQFADTHQPVILGFVNGYEVEQSGTHIRGLIWGLERAIGDYAYENGMVSQPSYAFIEDDLISGLTTVVSIWHPQPAFEGSARYKLTNPELKDDVFHLIWEALEEFSKHNPVGMRRIVQKCLDNQLLRVQRRCGL